MLHNSYWLWIPKHSTTFLARLQQLERTSNSGLCSEEYKFLEKHLDTYKRLQSVYAVKQSDVERARRAGQQCGLEFTQAVKKNDSR